MRNLPNIGVGVKNPNIKLTLTSRDGLETFVHCSHASDGLIQMSPISWQGRPQGGFGVPSGYTISISFPNSGGLEEIKSRLPKYNMATTDLQVEVNSDIYHPHLGRAREIRRNAQDPTMLNLVIVDRFLDDNPLIPSATMVDCFSAVHPEDIEGGYPWYYGDEGKRDFYFTAIDSNVGTMLGPRNVSSEAHNVSSIWWNSALRESSNIRTRTVKQVDKAWQQQSGDTNVASSDTNDGFLVRDIGGAAQSEGKASRLIDFGDIADVESGAGPFFIAVSCAGELLQAVHGQGKARLSLLTTAPNKASTLAISINKTVFADVISAHSWVLVSSFTFTGTPLGSSGELIISSGDNHLGTLIDSQTNQNLNTEYTTTNSGSQALTEDYATALKLDFTQESVSGQSGITRAPFRMKAKLILASDAYSRFSIYSPKLGSEIAVSENPIAILDHINSFDTGVQFITAQSSVAQTSLDNFKFHCFFADRREAQEIFDEFGEISATQMWIGDSGMMNYRTFAESSDAVVDKTITDADFEEGTFQIFENPIGSTTLQNTAVSKISVLYDFDFQKNSYERTLRATPSNNALCNSASAAGIENDMERKTKYIIDTDTASKYLGNLVRQNTQALNYITGTLTQDHLDLELYDIIRMQSKILVGSESLYQITTIEQDLLNGFVNITAAELQSLNPS